MDAAQPFAASHAGARAARLSHRSVLGREWTSRPANGRAARPPASRPGARPSADGHPAAHRWERARRGTKAGTGGGQGAVWTGPRHRSAQGRESACRQCAGRCSGLTGRVRARLPAAEARRARNGARMAARQAAAAAPGGVLREIGCAAGPKGCAYGPPAQWIRQISCTEAQRSTRGHAGTAYQPDWGPSPPPSAAAVVVALKRAPVLAATRTPRRSLRPCRDRALLRSDGRMDRQAGIGTAPARSRSRARLPRPMRDCAM